MLDLPESNDPQYRRDPITGRWVVIASSRAYRPHARPVVQEASAQDEVCPFCPGNEAMTPPETFAHRPGDVADASDWLVRVVPNKFPAASPKANGDASAPNDSLLFAMRPGVGSHEIVVECPEHRWSATHRDGDQFERIFSAYQARLSALSKTQGIVSALVFKNAGRSAGASQDHAHSQILATSQTPHLIAQELAGTETYRRRHGGSVFADLIAAELESGQRIVETTDHFVAFCPFASRFPFELCIAPLEASDRFERHPKEQLGELGKLVRSLLIRQEKALTKPAYNYFLHTPPFDEPPRPDYYWHVELAPRIVGVAGSEVGGGMFINPIPPEWAAQSTDKRANRNAPKCAAPNLPRTPRMGKIRFALTLHNHQPIGNFDDVIDGAYRDAYLPFLEVLEAHPWMPVSLHTSGCLLEWLVAHRPDYIARLRRLVERGQVEILGGGFYEPILTMIPSRDRRGQIRGYSEYLDELFGCRVRGMWTPERVWEQSLVKDVVAAGVEYTILDDFHFQKAGFANGDLVGSYFTEDEGALLRVIPGSEPMRYLIPFQEVDRVVDYLRDVHQRHNDALVVFADDGEKFGSWPNTKEHVYGRGWLHRFFEALRRNSDWLEVCTVGQAMEELEPLGRVYLPDCSYREMTEWALPTDRRLAYQRAWKELERRPDGGRISEFLRAGSWRNFKVRYPETNEMYARMLDVSGHLERLCTAHPELLSDPRLNAARTELYRGQCNCAYWHGAFGGLYLPHLRNAIYSSLIRAENRLIEFERGPRASFATIENRDFNLDGRPDVRMDNEHLSAFFDPAAGGMLYELDVRGVALNLGSSISRRPEEYHEKIRQVLGGGASELGRIQDHMVFKHDGLADRLHYDPYPRKSLIDHVYSSDTTLDDVLAGRAVEQGDFVGGKFKVTTAQSGDQVLASMARRGRAFDQEMTISKAASLAAGQRGFRIRYRLENLPADRPILFCVEWNFAGLAANADDRYFLDASGRKLGRLGERIDESACRGIGLVDEWLGIQVGLSLGKPAGIWSFPIQSVSQSEGDTNSSTKASA